MSAIGVVCCLFDICYTQLFHCAMKFDSKLATCTLMVDSGRLSDEASSHLRGLDT